MITVKILFSALKQKKPHQAKIKRAEKLFFSNTNFVIQCEKSTVYIEITQKKLL